MQATAIVAEILIVGLETAGWVLLVMLTVFGPHPVDQAFPSSDVVLGAIGLGAAYVLGVIVDRVADTSMTWLRDTSLGMWIADSFGKKSIARDRPDSEAGTEQGGKSRRSERHERMKRKAGQVGKKRLFVMYHGKDMGPFLEYQRSRHRIARATVFNLVFAIPSAATFAGFRGHAFQTEGGGILWAVGLVLALALLGVALVAYVRIEEAFIDRLNDAVEIIREHHPDLSYPQ